MHQISAPLHAGVRAEVARRVRDGLRDEIQVGRFPDGLLPQENALMRRYGASRNAVRLALNLLRSEGLVVRVQGIGTMVTRASSTPVPVDEPFGLDEVLDGGSTRVVYQPLTALAMPAPPGVADHLELPVGSDVVFLERVALLDGHPLTLRSAWIPADLGAPILERTVDLRQCIYDVFERGLGLELGLTELSIEAIVADETVASILEVSVGSPLLLIESVTRLADGRPAEFGHARNRADRLRLVRQALRRSGATRAADACLA